LDEPNKRDFYEEEARRGGWSVRQLDRQINAMLYERVALSRRRGALLGQAREDSARPIPDEAIKDPYLLEFLGLPEPHSEKDLENALIQHLADFLLELGYGFTFVARQRRFQIGSESYYLDLLLFHRGLRCLVAIDLKVGKFTHADAGQMNLYLNYLQENETWGGEAAPVGLILCAEKDEAEDLTSSEWRVVRGGSWSYNPWSLRSANRGRYVPAHRNDNIGVRCAQGVQ
jgi:predicted nuclease of restriction endonuclease-like (RecB) superfamily